MKMACVHDLRIVERGKRRKALLNTYDKDDINRMGRKFHIFRKMSKENIREEIFLPGSFGFVEIQDFFRVRNLLV